MTLGSNTRSSVVPDSVVEAFEEETGISVNVTTYSSNEDMLAKVKSETAGAYDIVQPSDYMVEQMAAQDMLLELDTDRWRTWIISGKPTGIPPMIPKESTRCPTWEVWPPSR